MGNQAAKRQLTSEERVVLDTLTRETHPHTGVYSIAPSSIAVSPRTPAEWKKLCLILSAKLKAINGKHQRVNFFAWTAPASGRVHHFLGFEMRRRDYVRDKKAGVNKIEARVGRGVYD